MHWLLPLLAAVMAAGPAPRAAARSRHADRGACAPGRFDCYHNYDELTGAMKELERRHPRNAFLYSIGKSVEGRELWVLAVAGVEPKRHVPARPEVQLVGNMHGDETVGRELLLRFAGHLLRQYEKNGDEAVVRVMNTSRLHLLPSMNPDGFERTLIGTCQMRSDKGRLNAAGVDLNRDFPDRWAARADHKPQPETAAVMRWTGRVPFTLAANFHGGVVVVNYPYDSYAAMQMDGAGHPAARRPHRTPRRRSKSMTPDDAEFVAISRLYASTARLAADAVGAYALDKRACHPAEQFDRGVTNGAEWYSVYGSLQDYLYRERGVHAVTVELSCCKAPSGNQLELFWRANRHALTQFPLWANTGVTGSVADADNTPIAGATLHIGGRESAPFATDAGGHFRRLLLPDDMPYTLVAAAAGYEPTSAQFTVESGRTRGPTVLNVTLRRAGSKHTSTLTTVGTPTTPEQYDDYGWYGGGLATTAASVSTHVHSVQATLRVVVETEVRTVPTTTTTTTTGAPPPLVAEASAGLSPPRWLCAALLCISVWRLAQP